jgi:large subunit ribosomal protein L3
MIKGAVPGSKGNGVTVKDAVQKPASENTMYPAGLVSLNKEANRLAEEAAAAAAAAEATAAAEAAAAEQAAMEAAENAPAAGGDNNEG